MKVGKGDYKDVLMQLNTDNQVIEFKYKCTVFNIFYVMKILFLVAIQFQKITTQLKKDISIHYSNKNWHADIYYYYNN